MKRAWVLGWVFVVSLFSCTEPATIPGGDLPGDRGGAIDRPNAGDGSTDPDPDAGAPADAANDG